MQAACDVAYLKLNVPPSIHRIRSFGRRHRLLQLQRLLAAAKHSLVGPDAQQGRTAWFPEVLYQIANTHKLPEGLGDHWHVSRQNLS